MSLTIRSMSREKEKKEQQSSHIPHRRTKRKPNTPSKQGQAKEIDEEALRKCKGIILPQKRLAYSKINTEEHNQQYLENYLPECENNLIYFLPPYPRDTLHDNENNEHLQKYDELILQYILQHNARARLDSDTPPDDECIRVAADDYGGLTVYATTDIPKNTKIAYYWGSIRSKYYMDSLKMSDLLQEADEDMAAYQEENLCIDLNAGVERAYELASLTGKGDGLCLVASRQCVAGYLNHASGNMANCKITHETDDDFYIQSCIEGKELDIDTVWIETIRDVKKDEPLTFDYKETLIGMKDGKRKNKEPFNADEHHDPESEYIEEYNMYDNLPPKKITKKEFQQLEALSSSSPSSKLPQVFVTDIHKQADNVNVAKYNAIISNLIVQPSTIPGGGDGLFTSIKRRAGSHIGYYYGYVRPNDMIGKMQKELSTNKMKGMAIKNSKWMKMSNSSENLLTDISRGILRQLAIRDGSRQHKINLTLTASRQCPAGYSNTASDPSQINCELMPVGMERRFRSVEGNHANKINLKTYKLVTTKPIQAGTELLWDYDVTDLHEMHTRTRIRTKLNAAGVVVVDEDVIDAVMEEEKENETETESESESESESEGQAKYHLPNTNYWFNAPFPTLLAPEIIDAPPLVSSSPSSSSKRPRSEFNNPSALTPSHKRQIIKKLVLPSEPINDSKSVSLPTSTAATTYITTIRLRASNPSSSSISALQSITKPIHVYDDSSVLYQVIHPFVKLCVVPPSIPSGSTVHTLRVTYHHHLADTPQAIAEYQFDVNDTFRVETSSENLFFLTTVFDETATQRIIDSVISTHAFELPPMPNVLWSNDSLFTSTDLLSTSTAVTSFIQLLDCFNTYQHISPLLHDILLTRITNALPLLYTFDFNTISEINTMIKDIVAAVPATTNHVQWIHIQQMIMACYHQEIKFGEGLDGNVYMPDQSGRLLPANMFRRLRPLTSDQIPGLNADVLEEYKQEIWYGDRIFELYFEILKPLVPKSVGFIDWVKGDDTLRSKLQRCMKHHRIIIMPYNENGNHWVVYVMDVEKRTVQYFNPFGATDDDIPVKMKQIITEQMRVYHFSPTAKPVTFTSICQSPPLQHDDHSCGPFAVLFIKYFLLYGENAAEAIEKLEALNVIAIRSTVMRSKSTTVVALRAMVMRDIMFNKIKPAIRYVSSSSSSNRVSNAPLRINSTSTSAPTPVYTTIHLSPAASPSSSSSTAAAEHRARVLQKLKERTQDIDLTNDDDEQPDETSSKTLGELFNNPENTPKRHNPGRATAKTQNYSYTSLLKKEVFKDARSAPSSVK